MHHVNGDHEDMREENLAFLCRECHYEVHRPFLERRGRFYNGGIDHSKTLYKEETHHEVTIDENKRSRRKKYRPFLKMK